jgi:hypothetical protein
MAARRSENRRQRPTNPKKAPAVAAIVDYAVPAGCPTAQEFVADVAAKSGNDGDPPDADVRVVDRGPAATGPRYIAVLTVRGEAPRSVDAETCKDAVDAVALVLSLRRAPPKPPVAPPPKAPEPPPAPPAAFRPRTEVSVRVGGGPLTGVFPTAAPAASLGIGAYSISDRIAGRLDLLAGFGSTTTAIANVAAPVPVDFSLFGARASLCVEPFRVLRSGASPGGDQAARRSGASPGGDQPAIRSGASPGGRFSAGACAGFLGALTSARASGFVGAASGQRVLLAPVPEVHASYRLFNRFAVELGVATPVWLSRPSYRFGNDPVFFKVAPASIAPSLALATIF